MEQIKTIPAMAALLDDCDHADVKCVEGAVGLEDFIRRMVTHRPAWLKGFYALRGGLAWMLRLRHAEIEEERDADRLDFAPGGLVGFFRSLDHGLGTHWLGIVEDTHLAAWFGVVREPLDDEIARFHVLTVVKHKHWTGPVYFTLIKPFHHLVVWMMARVGVRD
ncbi:MAG: DUF2867 domain-containing protein [Proteobacteria bacterium]|nr:DUF2867 domain-containing protein [Pseudomonadota bacterium]MBU1611035.1 DUF2867 domain-containing protein [Pseudomonadota bacterium]